MQFSRRSFLGATSVLAGLAGQTACLGQFSGSIGSSLTSSSSKRDDGKKPLEQTEKSRESIRRGLEWLNRAKTGSGGYGVGQGMRADIGCTAMVGLAHLADGSTPSQGPHKRKLQKIASYLIKKIETMPQHNITSKQGTQLQRKIGVQAHSFFALLYMTQIAGESHLPSLTLKSARKLTKAVTRSQLPSGGWGQQSWAPTLGTVMGWTSLRSAHFAGLEVGASPEKTADHLVKKMESELGAKPRHWMHQLYKNAAGIRVLYAMGKEDHEIVKKSFKEILKLVKDGNTAFNQAGGEEYLAFHLITETMLQKGGADWEAWFPVVRDKIVGVQNRDGSWTGHHCITSQTFCTAAACLVLSAPNRYLPISQQ